MLMLLPQEGACSNLSDNIVPCGRVVVASASAVVCMRKGLFVKVSL